MKSIPSLANIETDPAAEPDFIGTASYCMEDDKLRLYVGRVPREDYLALKDEGWTSTPKQSCDFVATWTPERNRTAILFAGVIDDEDMGPEERAADRAERFAGYQEKRIGEATGQADRYDAGPAVHGFQSYARAVRSADRHDRIAGRAVDAWEKAEYWQRRTSGVISHALYVSSPSVRMGRIKTLESELRKLEKDQSEWIAEWDRVSKIAADPAPLVSHIMTRFDKTQAEAEKDIAETVLGTCAKLTHPRNGNPENRYIFELIKDPDPVTLADFCAIWLAKYPTRPTAETSWTKHYNLRLAYENQMLEAQGGRAAFVEMEVGGWIGKHQIRKVNKSSATGRVVSVTLKIDGDRWGNSKEGFHLRPFNIERLSVDAYRAPTDEDKAALLAEKQKEKDESTAPKAASLINPTDEDAERLQEIWNEGKAEGKTSKVLRITQAQYSASRCETVIVCETGKEHRTRYATNITRHNAFKVRKGTSGDWYAADRVVVLTDKPQKPLPWAMLEKLRASCPTEEKLWDRLPEIAQETGKAWFSQTDQSLMSDAIYVGWVSYQSESQFSLTESGNKALREFNESTAVTA